MDDRRDEVIDPLVTSHLNLAPAIFLVSLLNRVAQFQEKILRAVLNGDLEDVVVTPQQM